MAMDRRPELYRPQPRGGGAQFNRPIVVVAFFLLSYLTLFSGIVGLVVAYVWKREATEEWEISHLRYLIRSVWLALLYMIASAGVIGLFAGALVATADAPTLGANVAADGMLKLGLGLGALAGGLGLFGTWLWFAVRCVLSLVNAMPRQPMPRPATWWL